MNYQPIPRLLIAEADLPVGTYQAYNDAGPAETRWRTYSGAEVPHFHQVGDAVQEKWRAAAQYAYDRGRRDGAEDGGCSRRQVEEALRLLTHLPEGDIQRVVVAIFEGTESSPAG